MSLLLVQNFPRSKEAIAKWAFNHDQEHRIIRTAVLSKKGVALQEYILDPFSYQDPQGWLARHQSAHNDFNAIVNYNGSDLEAVDFDNDKQRQAWSWFHWQEHVNINTVLGILT